MTHNTHWLEFLRQNHAHIDGEVVHHFGDPAAERDAATDGDILCELTQLGFIKASGEDAQSFLQNQFSNDINQVSSQHSQLNAYCNAKGRALALFRVIQFNDAYYLLLPLEIIEATLKRLRMFVLRSKVTLEDATDQLLVLGLSGPNAQTLVAEIVDDTPQGIDQSVTHGNLGVTRVRGEQPRYLVYGDYDNLTAAWKQLQNHTSVCAHHAWDYLDIHAGVPQIYQGNVEAFVPQMLNMHSIDGISFQKGCYPGQEVVARMYYLGKLKRRMYLAQVDSDTQPRPGDLLYNSDSKADQHIGRVVNAQPARDGGYDLLAVLQISSSQNRSVHLHSPDGAPLTLADLPYHVALERDKNA